MRSFWIVLLACAAAVSTPAAAGPFNDLERGLQGLVGQPLQQAIDRLGLPEERLDVGGETVYGWRTTSINGWSEEREELRCVVRLSVDAEQMVRRFSFDGNRGACSGFARRFRAVRAQQAPSPRSPK
jgi:hypothetical protein